MAGFSVTYAFGNADAVNGDGVSGGSITASNLATFNVNTSPSPAYTSAPVLQVAAASTTAADAVSANRYFTLTLTPDGDTSEWTPLAVTLNAARGGSATPRGFQVRHSANSYGSDLPGGGDVGSQRASWQARTIDLSGIGPLTGPLTLRFYVYMPTTGSTLEFDDIAVSGTYTGNFTPGAVSVGYTFDTTAYLPSITGSISASPLSISPTINSMEISSEYGYDTNPVGKITSTATDIATAVTNNQYWEFTVTPHPDAGSWTPTTFAMKVAKGGSGDRGWALRSSVDNYASNIYSSGEVPTVRVAWTLYDQDISSLGEQTGPVTFRVYWYANSTIGSLEHDNAVLSATTSGEAAGNDRSGSINLSGSGTLTTPGAPLGQPGIVQSNTSMLLQSAANTTHTHTFPAAATAGNLLYATIGTDKSSGTINAPSGWTLIGQSVGSSVSSARAYKIAEGGETSLTWTWTSTADAAFTFAEWNVTGAAIMGTPVTNAASETTVTSATVTGVAATGQGLAFAGVSIDTGYPLQWTVDDPTWSDGYTLAVKEIGLGDASAGSNGGACSAVGYKILENGTATTTTMSWTGADQASAFLDKFSYTGIAGGGGTGVAIDSVHYGNLSQTGATISTDTAPSASVRIKYDTDSGFTNPQFTSAVTADSTRGIAKHTLTGLTANTTYYYRVQVDSVDTTNGSGQFRTNPVPGTSYSRKIVFSSCRDTNSNSTVFNRIAARNPDQFWVLGDWHYQDINSTTASTYHSAYDEWQRQSNIRSLLLNTAHKYLWSDHDFCGNSSHGGSTGAATVRSVYKDRMAHGPHPASDGIYTTEVIGDALVIMLDTRSYRSPPGNTDNSSKRMLGATQEQWFYDTLAAATQPIIFVMSDVPWIGGGTQDDHWGSYQTEQARIVSTVPSSTWGKVIWLAGDAHMLAYDNGSNSPGGSPVWQAAALDRTGSTKGGPYSGGTNQGGGQYGVIDLVSDGTEITATYSGITSSDSTWGTHSVTRSLATTEEHSGSVSLTGSGTQARTGSPGTSGSTSLSGSGTQSRTGQPSVARTLALTGSGTLARTATPATSGSTTLTGSGTLSHAGQPTASGSTARTGAGSLTLSGQSTAQGSTSLSGSGTLTRTGSPSSTAQSALSGTGTLSLSGSASAPGSTALTGQGSLSTSATAEVTGSLSRSGEGTLATTGAPSWSSDLDLSGTGSLDLNQDALTLSGSTDLSGSGLLTRLGGGTLGDTINLTGSGMLDPNGDALAVSGDVDLSGTGTLSGVGTEVTASGSTDLSGSGTLTFSAQGAGSGSLSLSGTGSLDSEQDTLSASTSAPLTGSGSLTLTGTPSLDSVASLDGTGTLSLAGAGAEAGESAIALSGTGALSLEGLASENPEDSLSLSGSGTLTFQSSVTTGGSLSMSGTGNSGTPDPFPAISGTASFGGTGMILLTPQERGTGTLVLSGSGQISLSGGTSLADVDIRITLAPSPWAGTLTDSPWVATFPPVHWAAHIMEESLHIESKDYVRVDLSASPDFTGTVEIRIDDGPWLTATDLGDGIYGVLVGPGTSTVLSTGVREVEARVQVDGSDLQPVVSVGKFLATN